MDFHDALALLRPAVSVQPPGTHWADLGAGTGLFTWALAALLGPEATVTAIDRNEATLRTLRTETRHVPPGAAGIRTLAADFRNVDLPSLSPLDGVLFANSLHFIPDPTSLLTTLARHLQPHGRIVIVEYDRSASSRWVPYPISSNRLLTLSETLPLAPPRFVSSQPSAFGGRIYCAVLLRTNL